MHSQGVGKYYGRFRQVAVGLIKSIFRRKKPKEELGVWAVYDGQMADMRRQGYSLQAIGDVVGVTRERIRQILGRRYGRVEMEVLNEEAAARALGCPSHKLRGLRKRGMIHPEHHGLRWAYSLEQIKRAKALLKPICSCGCKLPINYLGKYCPKCGELRSRHRYLLSSEEAKERHKEMVRRWRERNRERYRETLRRAAIKRSREYFAATRYVVFAGDVLPVGTIIRAVGWDNGRLVLEGGQRIPARHVTILRGREDEKGRQDKVPILRY